MAHFGLIHFLDKKSQKKLNYFLQIVTYKKINNIIFYETLKAQAKNLSQKFKTIFKILFSG